MADIHECYYCKRQMDSDAEDRDDPNSPNYFYSIYVPELENEGDVCEQHFPGAGTDIFLWPKTDKDGDEIYWGLCIACKERTHHKVKEVTERQMEPGETYHYMHKECADRMRRYRK